MGNKTSQQTNIPVATNIHVVNATAVAQGYIYGVVIQEETTRQQVRKTPSAPPMPEPSAPPMPTETLPLRNQYRVHSDNCDNTGIQNHPKNYFTDPYERALREAIDRTYVALARDILKTGKLDNVDILTREIDYLNHRMSYSKHNIRRLQMKELIEERMKIVLR